ncbi:MAG TPA: sulfatase-like hydrolase/transferase, partial [Thermoanaerobaculia bacterium]|nr:sulfatase-like hydrolase/transferase [Thermoanaerobaculia bacterium]
MLSGMKLSPGRLSGLLALGVLSLVTLAALAAWGFAARRPRRPNVILVSIDTLRADHLGSYGYRLPTTPCLDRFRADAVLFAEAVAQASSTLPSHASIFTSMIPQHHGASHTWNLPLADAAVTLTEVLQAEGYRTLAVVGGGQLQPVYGLGQGFDVYDDLGEESPFGAVVRRGLDRLAGGGQEPFFLFLHSYEVHHPYTPAPGRLAALDSGYSGSLPKDISIALLTDINEGRLKIDAADLR